ncbi:RluA family pseudouridine synthase [Helicobacter sp. MIT 14-3879]|uniref:RluA family pseudouridine synthase n=1 Tax=Helicobacter sp. MIT 14-3879 TaxID=2040649 RepID=UPI000E1E7431|nr:RluA family pseudouridine synthase [Helicobacter sp. MIT 14-3879]RDU62903.1 RNA pseudouridine synthase [Helicobacter sp. MIT 14-3879]
MPFIKQTFYIKEKIKAISFLQQHFNINLKIAQKIIDKGRIENNGKIFLNKAGFLIGEVKISYFKPIKLNIKPIFETKNFAIFDKPPKLLVHPKGRFKHISLLDSIRFYLGENANPINRLDSETSGILLVSKDKKSEVELKRMFESRKVKKTYLAYVYGKIKDSVLNYNILEQNRKSDLGIKSTIDNKGKIATTIIKLINYDSSNDISLIQAIPITGRTHQIRLHLSHIGHRIVGESLYGVDDKLARNFLDGKIDDECRKKIFGAERLMLHSYILEFQYNENRFFITSKMSFDRL